MRWDATSEGRRGERRDADLTMVRQEAKEVVKELFVFKGLEKIGLERTWMETSKSLLVAHVALQSLGGNLGVLRLSSHLLPACGFERQASHAGHQQSDLFLLPPLPSLVGEGTVTWVASASPWKRSCGGSVTGLLMHLVGVRIMASLLG